MIDFSYDEATGIVSSKASGLLTVDEAREAYRRASELMRRARLKFGYARYLVDAREAVVQPREVIDEVERLGSYIKHPKDRMAVVLASNLSKMQTQRIFPSDQEAAFLSMDEARAWLLSD